MADTHSIRFRITRRGVGRALAGALVALSPLALESQEDNSRKLVMNTYFPAPVGAFAQVMVTGGAPIILARDGGGVGVGDIGASPPQAALVAAGATVIGQNVTPRGGMILSLTDGSNGTGVLSGVSFGNRLTPPGQELIGSRWRVFPQLELGSYMLWHENPSGQKVFGIDATSNGALRACIWVQNPAGCSAAGAGFVSMFHGQNGFEPSWGAATPATPSNVAYYCPANSGPCVHNPAASVHLCCLIRAP